MWYYFLDQRESMGLLRAKGAGQRSRTVREDWSAWLPDDMDRLFGATRKDLESSNLILCVTLDEALSFCEEEQFDMARERAVVFAELFDRLAICLRHVIRAIEDHGSHFGTLPNVTSLASANFRGTTAQKIAFMDNLLAKVVFRGRTRFFHKLNALKEIVEELQTETRAIVKDISRGTLAFPDRGWKELEVLGYDLNTCMGETTVVLKSFFCVLPPEELESFQKRLIMHLPALLAADPKRE
jgi:hypothetical protein